VPGDDLVTPRLLLRRFRPADAIAHHAAIYGDEEVVRGLGRLAVADVAASEAMIARAEAHWAAEGFGVRAVCDRTDGRLIGQAGLRRLPELGDEVEVLYALARPAWGRGLATEAALACLREAFGPLALDRVIGLVLHSNPASRRVLERCGLRYERDVELWGLELELLALARARTQGRSQA